MGEFLEKEKDNTQTNKPRSRGVTVLYTLYATRGISIELHSSLHLSVKHWFEQAPWGTLVSATFIKLLVCWFFSRLTMRKMWTFLSWFIFKTLKWLSLFLSDICNMSITKQGNAIHKHEAKNGFVYISFPQWNSMFSLQVQRLQVLHTALTCEATVSAEKSNCCFRAQEGKFHFSACLWSKDKTKRALVRTAPRQTIADLILLWPKAKRPWKSQWK